ncbi:hypothetical protein [Lysobacter capsici]|uniref:hypothetical protein n=1 Tax=Lysobacter capsici TaxID=435897 RepID=UPI001E41F36F|nr:hypothetical protein [Lysobacter capsici]
MSRRLQLDIELDRLEQMLPHWRETMRHEAQFWPQFRALLEPIVEGLDRDDRQYVEERVARMLTLNGCDPGKRHGEGW